MNIFKFYFSLFIAKIIYFILKFSKISGGTAIIGYFVLKICPDFLIHANNHISKSKINITGTNGKTTTSGIISHLIKEDNHSIVNNELGANMLTGIVNALAIQLSHNKKHDYSIIECDEAFLEVIYNKFNADYLIVTNLFRDQLDRYGELTTTKQYIQNGIDKKENLQLLLNADDPLVATLKSKNKNPIFYGFENVIYENDYINKECIVEEHFSCSCGKDLKYHKKFYAQQGHYFCECGYKRPKTKYSADVYLHKNFSIIKLENEEYKIPLVGLFNAYNALGAIVLAKELDINNIKKNIETFKVAFGRSEIKFLNGKKTIIQLIKNPVGASEVLKSIDLNSKILICINDNYADGRDVSWLWDANFETLSDLKSEIVVSGTRADDIALRLKYAGLAPENIKIIHDIDNAINYVDKTTNSDITILPTYTALLKINKMKKLRRK